MPEGRLSGQPRCSVSSAGAARPLDRDPTSSLPCPSLPFPSRPGGAGRVFQTRPPCRPSGAAPLNPRGGHRRTRPGPVPLAPLEPIPCLCPPGPIREGRLGGGRTASVMGGAAGQSAPEPDG